MTMDAAFDRVRQSRARGCEIFLEEPQGALAEIALGKK